MAARFYNVSGRKVRGAVWRLFLALVGMLVLSPGLLRAQTEDAAELPDAKAVAQRLADPALRHEALLKIAVVARFLNRAERGLPAPATLEEDTAWLQRLEQRLGERTLRSPVLDPSAWLIHLELTLRNLPPQPLVEPSGPDLPVVMDRVFDRSDERLASVILPELLWMLEPRAVEIWQALEQLLENDEALADSLRVSLAASFADWAGGAPDVPEIVTGKQFSGMLVAALDEMVLTAVGEGPPDPDLIRWTRYQVALALPSLEPEQELEAIGFFRLATLVDGLHEGHYFSFAEGLIPLASLLIETRDEARLSNLRQWLARQLPVISSAFARQFAAIDPRLNSTLAAVYDVVSHLQGPADGDQDRQPLRQELADAVAQLALLVPDLGYYFNLPVRDTIAGGTDACTGLMARTEDDGSPAMTRELFDDCQQSIVDLADNEARVAALAGDPDGPFGSAQLSRELNLTSGQRINYGIGYLHDRYRTGCPKPARPLPNPLEWSALATLLAWFAEQTPIYFQTPDNEARLSRMRAIGQELMSVLAQQVDCLAGVGAALNDPVSRTLVDYREALVALSSGISSVISANRSRVLAAGADVTLDGGAGQSTVYRPDDLMIEPCDIERVCEMSNPLTSTRALLGLFPDEYLVADQSRMGEVEICYENMSWVQRRSEQVRADDTNVANYYGKLSFELKGRYRQQGVASEIFGFRFTSPEEHHYLFGAMNEEVLNDECPVEWVGRKIVTPLKENRSGIVPNRLTYLSAPRMLPSRLLAGNWDKGAEWRDWFITGIGVVPLQIEQPASITNELDQHLQALYRAEQAAVYSSLLQPPIRGVTPYLESLADRTDQLTTVKLLIRQQFVLFYPQVLNESDELRSAIAGQGGLVDGNLLSRFRADNIPVQSINQIAFERLKRTEDAWRDQPDLIRRTGSIAGSLAHAMMRLNALYDRFFASPAPVSTPESGPAPQSEPDSEPESESGSEPEAAGANAARSGD